MTLGILAALSASIIAVAKDIVSKKISSNIDPFVSSFASFLYAIPFYILLLTSLYLIGLESFYWQPGFWGYVTIKAISDAGAESGKMFALKSGELSTVSAILSLHPIFTLVFSPLITGDQITNQIILGVVLATIGTYFFTRVPKKIDLVTLAAALFASMCFALNNCFDRLSATSASAAFSGFAMNLTAAAITFPIMLFATKIPVIKQDLSRNMAPLFLRGVFEVSFMTIKLLALSALQAPVVSAVMRCNLVFQVIAGRSLFQEQGLINRVIGCVLIIAGALLSLTV